MRLYIADKSMIHDNKAPCNPALSVPQFLTLKDIPVVPQPSNHLTLVPLTFSFLHKLKNVLKGRHFGALDNIRKNVTDMMKNEESYRLKGFSATIKNGSNVSIGV